MTKDKIWNVNPKVKIPSSIVPKKVTELTTAKKILLVGVFICLTSFAIGFTASVIDSYTPGPAMLGVLNLTCFIICMVTGFALIIAGILYVILDD